MFFEEKHSKLQYWTTLHYYEMKSFPHCQTTMEILFVMNGVCSAVRQDNTYQIPGGQCIWILPYEVHAYDSITSNEVMVYIFSSDMMPDFEQAVRGHILKDPVIPFTDDILPILSQKNDDLFQKKSVMYNLASRVIHNGLEKREKTYDFDLRVRIMLFIQDHYRESITLHDLAEHLGYSYHYVSALFHDHFSVGFCELVNMYRLDAARKYLHEGNLSMTQISSDAGFSTIRSFNMAFQKKFNMTPTEYQHSHEYIPEDVWPDFETAARSDE